MEEQWVERPDDMKWDKLDHLYDYTHNRAQRSQVDVVPNKHLETIGTVDENGKKKFSVVTNTDRYGWGQLNPTHWSFGQLCTRSEVPAVWARRTHPEIAALAMNYGLTFGSNTSDESKIMVIRGDNGEVLDMHCMTSPTYGRVFDYEVVDVTRRVIQRSGNNWDIPWARDVRSSSTGAYLSDRDVNIFLTDSERTISVYDPKLGRERMLHRGVIIGNSEVGARKFFIKTFFYDNYCTNRVIFGMKNVRELGIRHTSGAPQRFLHEGVPLLKQIAEASPQREEELFAKAVQFNVGKDEDSIRNWLKKRAFTVQQANAVIRNARQETGELPTSLWDVVQSGTAMAKRIQHTDARMKEEESYGRLLKYAEA